MNSPGDHQHPPGWPDAENWDTSADIGDAVFGDHPPPRRWPTVLSAVALVVVAGVALVVAVAHGGRTLVTGSPAAGAPPTETSAAATRAADSITVINPVSGLTYQVPAVGWTVQQRVGDVAGVVLTQGARRSAYTCGNPVRLFLRGSLGSGATAATDPSDLAGALADQLATQLYASSNGITPRVRVSPAQPVSRRTPSGATVSGAQAQAVATQSGDPCLASSGEVIVLVLRLADHDAVFMVNGDLAGGPADPAPTTDEELRRIVDGVRPIDG